MIKFTEDISLPIYEKIIILIIIVLLIIAVSFIAFRSLAAHKSLSVKSNESWSKYTSEKNDYTISYPSGDFIPAVDTSGEASVVTIYENEHGTRFIIAFSAQRNENEYKRMLARIPNSCKTHMLQNESIVICFHHSYQVESDPGNVGGGDQSELAVYFGDKRYHLAIGNLPASDI